MKNSISTFFVLAFSTFSLFAQTKTRSWGEFNMIPVTSFNDRVAESELIKSGPEYDKARKVYERLCDARGDLRYPAPIFLLTKEEGVVAKISYDKPEKIYLSLKAFKVCESFKHQSEAAIAFLLGHELTHYYEKHAWRWEFANSKNNLKIKRELDSLSRILTQDPKQKLTKDAAAFESLIHEFDHVALEAQSDYLGGFLVYSAGFGIFDKGDTLIQKLYKEFKLDDNMEGYITRSERETMNRQSAARMKDLVEIFDMANLLSAIGRYPEAYQYYRFILSEYQSRELYNNVGATAMMQALKLFTSDEQGYRYPIQMDLEMAKSRGDEAVEKRTKLLNQAILHFDAAISMDPNYAPAFLNKACALALLDDYKRAYFYADVETRSVALGQYAGLLKDVEVLLGILDAKTKTTEGIASAKKRFATIAAQKGGELAAYNLEKLNNPAKTELVKDEIVEEEIDGSSIFLMEADIEANLDPLKVGQGLSFIRNPKKTANGQLYTSKSSDGFTKFHLTNLDYPGKTSEGLSRGASREDILKAYKSYSETPKSIKTITGEILIYNGVLFMLNDGKLARWVVYAEPNK